MKKLIDKIVYQVYYLAMNNNSKNKELISELSELVRRLNYFGQMPMEYVKGEKLYPSEINTIGVIGQYPELNQTEIAAKMGVTKGAISRMTKKLEQKNLIQKRQMPDNKKERYLSLTESGQNIFNYHEEFHRNMDAMLLKEIDSMTEEEKSGIRKLLNVAENLLDDIRESVE